MSPKQVTELLVGIAKAQAAVLAAIHATVEKHGAVSSATQAAIENLFVLSGTKKNKPLTLQTLPAKVLMDALVPGSHAGKTILETTLAEVERLLT